MTEVAEIEQAEFCTVKSVAEQLVQMLKPHLKMRSAMRRVYRAIDEKKLSAIVPEERSKIVYFVPVGEAQAYLDKFKPKCG